MDDGRVLDGWIDGWMVFIDLKGKFRNIGE